MSVACQIVAKGQKAACLYVHPGQIIDETSHRLAIHVHRVHKPAFLLIFVVKLLCEAEMLAHHPHATCKRIDMSEQSRIFQVTHDFLAIRNRVDRV